MNNKQYKVEEAIMGCWTIVDDLKLLRETKNTCQEHKDSYLLGLENIYAVKFASLYEAFINSLKN